MKNLLMFISSLMMMLPLEAQNESNPFTGAWQRIGFISLPLRLVLDI